MYWYLVHTKPRQELRALQNLEQQGYPCYLPVLPAEKIRQGVLKVMDDPLFPRYLFIQLGQSESARSWAPIRSTKGVSGLVRFGVELAKAGEPLIEFLREQEKSRKEDPERLFVAGERVRLTEGAFAGVEGVFQMTDGNNRVRVLIELLSTTVAVRVVPATLRKTG